MKRIAPFLIALLLSPPATAPAADPDRGGLLFASPTLGGGTSGKSCLTCHEDGRDFSQETVSKKRYEVMGIVMRSLPEVINFCIEVTLRGEGLDEAGRDMEDLIAFLALFSRQEGKGPK